jgi:hypothetical protein
MTIFPCTNFIQVANVRRESPGALLVLLTNGREVWIPKSQIDDTSTVWGLNQSGQMTVNRRFAKKHDLISEE